MNTVELLQLARLQLDDNSSLEMDQLWTDTELLAYLNEACDEFCRSTYAIEDDETTTICQITTVVNQKTYSLNDRIIRVKAVKDSDGRTLDNFSKEEMDKYFVGWDINATTPWNWFVNPDGTKLVINKPDAISTLYLTVQRRQKVDLATTATQTPVPGDGYMPEIKAEYHPKLMFWVKYKAYSKGDEDTKNDKKMADNITLWNQFIEYVKREQKRNAPGPSRVRPNYGAL